MKRTLTISLLMLLTAAGLFMRPVEAAAQSGQKTIQQRGGGYFARIEVVDGDTIQVVDLLPVFKFKRPIDLRRYEKLVRNVKKVYPIAKEAKAKLALMEEELLTIKGKKEQKAYIKRMEKEIKAQYTPVLKKMTFSQGKILIKLIDRETTRTSYAIVKELRGGFSAFFWQGIARIFGANLKDTYDKDGDDKMIEQIIMLYEAGVI